MLLLWYIFMFICFCLKSILATFHPCWLQFISWTYEIVTWFKSQDFILKVFKRGLIPFPTLPPILTYLFYVSGIISFRFSFLFLFATVSRCTHTFYFFFLAQNIAFYIHSLVSSFFHLTTYLGNHPILVHRDLPSSFYNCLVLYCVLNWGTTVCSPMYGH